jgi:hypothetical protein
VSSSAEEPKFRLIVEGGSPSAEVFVIDGRYNLCAKGMERLEAELPAGLYKVKVRASTFIKEQPVELAPENSPLTIRFAPEELQFASAAPLPDTSTTHEYHRWAAEYYSKQPQVHLGTASEVFMFCRDIEPGRTDDPAAGLTLHKLDGAPVLNFSEAGQLYAGDEFRAPSNACCAAVDPGGYLLRVDAGEAGQLEQTIVASAGWQTQVFLVRREYGDGNPLYRANLNVAAILMNRIGHGFEPDRPDLRWAEMACQRLALGRTGAPDSMLQQMLDQKLDNPMLGIYGGHNLLRADEPDRRLVEDVYRNLLALIGPHPDVLSLGVWLGETGKQFLYPPMLRSSWKILVQRSVAEPDIIPAGSLGAQMATRVWGGGAWLVWDAQERTQSAASNLVDDPESTLDDVERMLLGYLRQASEREFAAKKLLSKAVVHTRVMDKMRKRISGRTQGFLKEAYESALRGLEKSADERVNEEKLVEVLGIPRSALHEAAAGLQKKLKL